MATSADYVEFVCAQAEGTGTVVSRKMFGEYMVYINGKPILLVCDNMVFVKKLDEIAEIMKDAETGFPYEGAKPHYILDIDNGQKCRDVINILEPITPLPKPRKKKK